MNTYKVDNVANMVICFDLTLDLNGLISIFDLIL